MSTLFNSPVWQLSQLQGVLVLSAGADESYVVDEAREPSTIARLLAGWADGSLGALRDDLDCGAAVRQLQRIGALVPREAVRPVLRHAIKWLGDPLPWLEQALAPKPASMDAAPDLVVLIRTNAQWLRALADYAERTPERPHLLVDLAYHHTLSLGPYVVPGDTACVACLGHRIAHRWGDFALPALPAVQQHQALIAALVAHAIGSEGGAAARSSSIECVFSLDLQTLASRKERVFRNPWCPVCSGRVRDGAPTGRLNLPWIADA